MFEEAGDIGLVPGNSVERFGQHHLEEAALSIAHELLDAVPQNCARSVGAGHLPSLTRRLQPAKVELVVFAAEELEDSEGFVADTWITGSIFGP